MLREVMRIHMGTLEKDLSVCCGRVAGVEVGTGGRCTGLVGGQGRRFIKEGCNWNQILTLFSPLQSMRQKDMKGMGRGVRYPLSRICSLRFGF